MLGGEEGWGGCGVENCHEVIFVRLMDLRDLVEVGCSGWFGFALNWEGVAGIVCDWCLMDEEEFDESVFLGGGGGMEGFEASRSLGVSECGLMP